MLVRTGWKPRGPHSPRPPECPFSVAGGPGSEASADLGTEEGTTRPPSRAARGWGRDGRRGGPELDPTDNVESDPVQTVQWVRLGPELCRLQWEAGFSSPRREREREGGGTAPATLWSAHSAPVSGLCRRLRACSDRMGT